MDDLPLDLVQYLGALAPPAGDGAGGGAEAPAWLTTPYLAEAQADVAERTLEISTRLAAGLEAPGPMDYGEPRMRLAAAGRQA